MKTEIIEWCKEAKKRYSRYGLEITYMANKDLYRIMIKNKPVMMFYSDTFYQIPRRMRLNHIEPMVKLGLVHNLGEQAYADQLYQMKSHGKKVC